MERTKFKLESGIQLLTRLSTRKTKFENFYPKLFQSDPKPGEVIEIFSNTSSSFLLMDMICEATLPLNFGGADTGVLILNTDGHISMQALIVSLKDKLNLRYNFRPSSAGHYGTVLKHMLHNLYILDIFDSTQLYTTFQNLDNMFIKNNISLCVVDTLTAFYWSEQSFKITKMDVYIKNLLHIIQKAVHGHEVTIIYTRPEYFSSGKDSLENLEAVVETPTIDKINCRIQLVQNEDETYTANVMTHNNTASRNFSIQNKQIVWL